MRGLSELFFDDLQAGCLKCFLNAVKSDDTLCLEIREKYINIYYRGGNLYRIEHIKGMLYDIRFDMEYCNHKVNILSIFDSANFNSLKGSINYDEYVKFIPALKMEMDLYFKEHGKNEREYQQLVLRENSYSGSEVNGNGVSKDTDYFIIDIEYANSLNESRFDMVAVKWLSTPTERRSSQNASLTFIEMKYADSAHSGAAGIKKHFEDMDRFVSANFGNSLLELYEEMENVFNQKMSLGLIKGVNKQLIFNRNIKPEFIILAGNHKPQKSVFKRELRAADELVPTLKNKVDIKIALASNMGYGLYAEYMLNLDTYLKVVSEI